MIARKKSDLGKIILKVIFKKKLKRSDQVYFIKTIMILDQDHAKFDLRS
jgi:hypothetical protein